MDNVTIHILDEQLNEVAKGEQGELCISGINLAYGYLNRPT
jgi:non-ribosomal peptide synthetase component F